MKVVGQENQCYNKMTQVNLTGKQFVKKVLLTYRSQVMTDETLL